MQIYKATPGLIIADTPYVHAAIEQISPGKYLEKRYSDSDSVYLFMNGQIKLTTTNLIAPRQAYIPIGIPYVIKNISTEPVKFIWAVAPNPKFSNESKKNAAITASNLDNLEGTAIMDIASGKRFPKSPRIRGGMLYFEPGFECAYHSHDAAEEVFFFLQGRCLISVEGEAEEVGAEEVVFVPADHKHKLKALGSEPLIMWLTVTPNREKSHTFS